MPSARGDATIVSAVVSPDVMGTLSRSARVFRRARSASSCQSIDAPCPAREPPAERASELVYQVLLSKKPNRGCWATITIGGAMRTFAILRLCTGFFGSDGLSSANDCSARDLAETSATVVWAGALTAIVAVCRGTIVGRLVSKTTRSGHLRSDWILMPDLDGPASALSTSTGNFGSTSLLRSSSASRTPPTNKKYRAKGISGSLPPRGRADHSLNWG